MVFTGPVHNTVTQVEDPRVLFLRGDMVIEHKSVRDPVEALTEKSLSVIFQAQGVFSGGCVDIKYFFPLDIVLGGIL